jgi:hypothetical protein
MQGRRRKIEKIPSAVATLSRRAEYLDERLQEHGGEDRHKQFDRREAGALRTAIDAMNLAQLFQRTESDPIALLEELVDAVDIFRHVPDDADDQELDETLANLLEIQARARSTIALADAYLEPGEPGARS